MTSFKRHAIAFSGSLLVGSLGSAHASNLCASPVSFVCKSQPGRPAQEAREQFSLLVSRKETLGRIAQAYSADGVCPSLLLDTGSLSCERQVQIMIEREIYLPDRMTKAKSLFEEARRTMLAFLTADVLPKAADPDAQQELREGIERIRRAQPEFGLKNPAMRNSEYWQLLADPLAEQVHVGGPIVWADRAPEALQLAFAHELAHFIDPVTVTIVRNPKRLAHFEFRSPAQRFAFQETSVCLQRFANSRDDACIDRALADEPMTPTVSELRTLLRTNPHYNPGGPILARICQMDQLQETFADWLAVEAMAPTIATGNADHIAAYASVFCDDQSWEGLPPDPTDSHPSQESRVERIFMAHPLIRAAGDCEAALQKNAHCAF